MRMERLTAFFRTVGGKLPTVPPRELLLAAGLVWLAAGVNIFSSGRAGHGFPTGEVPCSLLCALAVFLVFFPHAIFRRLVTKHTARILAYEARRIWSYISLTKRATSSWLL